MSFLRRFDTSGGINCNRPATADGKRDYTSMHKYYSVTQKCVDETVALLLAGCSFTLSSRGLEPVAIIDRDIDTFKLSL